MKKLSYRAFLLVASAVLADLLTHDVCAVELDPSDSSSERSIASIDANSLADGGTPPFQDPKVPENQSNIDTGEPKWTLIQAQIHEQVHAIEKRLSTETDLTSSVWEEIATGIKPFHNVDLMMAAMQKAPKAPLSLTCDFLAKRMTDQERRVCLNQWYRQWRNGHYPTNRQLRQIIGNFTSDQIMDTVYFWKCPDWYVFKQLLQCVLDTATSSYCMIVPDHKRIQKDQHHRELVRATFALLTDLLFVPASYQLQQYCLTEKPVCRQAWKAALFLHRNPTWINKSDHGKIVYALSMAAMLNTHTQQDQVAQIVFNAIWDQEPTRTQSNNALLNNFIYCIQKIHTSGFDDDLFLKKESDFLNFFVNDVIRLYVEKKPKRRRNVNQYRHDDAYWRLRAHEVWDTMHEVFRIVPFHQMTIESCEVNLPVWCQWWDALMQDNNEAFNATVGRRITKYLVNIGDGELIEQARQWISTHEQELSRPHLIIQYLDEPMSGSDSDDSGITIVDNEEGVVVANEEGTIVDNEEGAIVDSEEGAIVDSEEGAIFDSAEGTIVVSEEGVVGALNNEHPPMIRSEISDLVASGQQIQTTIGIKRDRTQGEDQLSSDASESFSALESDHKRKRRE